MGIADPYITLAQMKARMGITETTRDTEMSAALLAASRACDDYCARTFWVDATVTARTYRTYGRVVKTDDGYWLIIDDVATDVGLIVEVSDDGSTWTDVTTDVELVRFDPARTNWPYTCLAADSDVFHVKHVRVTAKWGWVSVPTEVSEACRLLAARFFRRKDSPEGVLGSADWGTVRVSRYDPDVDRLLRPFRRVSF